MLAVLITIGVGADIFVLQHLYLSTLMSGTTTVQLACLLVFGPEQPSFLRVDLIYVSHMCF